MLRLTTRSVFPSSAALSRVLWADEPWSADDEHAVEVALSTQPVCARVMRSAQTLLRLAAVAGYEGDEQDHLSLRRLARSDECRARSEVPPSGGGAAAANAARKTLKPRKDILVSSCPIGMFSLATVWAIRRLAALKIQGMEVLFVAAWMKRVDLNTQVAEALLSPGLRFSIDNTLCCG